MKIHKEITIHANADKVWSVFADDFHNVGNWLTQISASKALEHQAITDAPVSGRICDITSKPNGPQAIEKITYYNANNYHFEFDVTFNNTPSALPVVKNHVKVKIDIIDLNTSRLTWDSDITLKFLGKLISPLVKVGISKSFDELLDDFQYFVENDTPHPRKLVQLEKNKLSA
ncbi:SRPBCC family protein [Flammeovirga agarivorans]|uniref:SRPBCC family protein n=1 Tax=Flammeovirga agarivorans TaxID=2726742 RepID=A0A7X8SKV6_9BACT|nr:SRPBCC family protein [Flammeovirga agarivorans]NLR92084.1 SRPBCC family protein [Flammeovirga agarivorans]